jgi:hypothetical protein
MAVDEWDPHRPWLSETHESVVYRLVTVRVVFLHGVTDSRHGLAVRLVGTLAAFEHRVQNAALHRLESVTGIWDGT